jgi:hypothetical protein
MKLPADPWAEFPFHSRKLREFQAKANYLNVSVVRRCEKQKKGAWNHENSGYVPGEGP